jgi:uncharacterized repeat protein (TIGR01451 family)
MLPLVFALVLFALGIGPVGGVPRAQADNGMTVSKSSDGDPIIPAISASSDVLIGGATLSKTGVVHQPQDNAPNGRVTVGDASGRRHYRTPLQQRAGVHVARSQRQPASRRSGAKRLRVRWRLRFGQFRSGARRGGVDPRHAGGRRPQPSETLILNTGAASVSGLAVPLLFAPLAQDEVPCTVPPVISNTTQHPVLSAPNFTIVKAVLPTSPVKAVDPLQYVMLVRNDRTEDATNVVVNDTLPDGTTYLDASARVGGGPF